MSINALTLLTLLPFLASLQLIAATPLARSQNEPRQAQSVAATPLTFQSVSQSMGISAQMVSGDDCLANLGPLAHYRCSSVTRKRSTSWTSRRTTRCRSLVNSVRTQPGVSNMTSLPTTVSCVSVNLPDTADNRPNHGCRLQHILCWWWCPR
jgi:hypothetical protein